MTNYLYSTVEFLKFIFFPLIKGVRSFGLILLLLYIYPGFVLTFLEIPRIDQALVVKGVFVDSTKEYSRNGQHAIKIRDGAGVVHACICSASNNYPNCLSRDYSKNRKLSEMLSGKSVELLYYPSGSIYGDGNLCYQISDNEKIWLSFDESAAIYKVEKNEAIVHIFWLFSCLFATYICTRIYQFTRRK